MFVLILLAAVLNVLVAWGCALWTDPGPHAHVFAGPNGDPLANVTSTEWQERDGRLGLSLSDFHAQRVLLEMRAEQFMTAAGTEPVPVRNFDRSISIAKGAGLKVSRLDMSPFAPAHPLRGLAAVESGWPLPSFTGFVVDPLIAGKRASSPRPWLALRGPTIFGAGRHLYMEVPILPLIPLWTGFLANTAFYAGVLGLAAWRLDVGKRRRRRKRNRCPACGYSRAGLAAGATCPECGTMRKDATGLAPQS